MNRLEFIKICEKFTREELLEKAAVFRETMEKRVSEEMNSRFRSLDDMTEVEDLYVETSWGKTHVIVVQDMKNCSAKRPVLVNVHGGGWTLPHSERDVYFCRRMAADTGCLIFDVDYVLAPEFPYPAAIEELEAFLDILPDLCCQYNGDPERIILCGQSAGGNLLGAVTQRRKSRIRPLAQILCYLPADNYNDHFNGGDLDENGMRTEYYGFFYNCSLEERSNHDVSLALSSVEECKGLPATDIITAGFDNLQAEGERYYNLLYDAGNVCTYRCFKKSHHGFLVNLYDEWQEGEKYVAGLIRKHLNL